MKQALLNTISLATVGTVAPGTSVTSVPGTSLATFQSSASTGLVYIPKRFLVECTVTGTGTCKLTMYAAATNGFWAIPVDGNGNLGIVAGGVALGVGTYFFMLEDMGLFSAICISKTDVSGSPSVTATISGVSEKQE